jgi:uncharacterized protein (DUF2252 family)
MMGRHILFETSLVMRRVNSKNAMKDTEKPVAPKRSTPLSWLWSSVVELAATHEAAYLEHCRQYALDRASA